MSSAPHRLGGRADRTTVGPVWHAEQDVASLFSLATQDPRFGRQSRVAKGSRLAACALRVPLRGSPDVWNDVAGARDHAADRDQVPDVAGVEVAHNLGLPQVERLDLRPGAA
jgi:hypothetical protein